LDRLRLDSSSGPVRLDRNRQAVVPVTLGRIDGTTGGAPSLRPVARIGEVDQTLGGLLAPSFSPGRAVADCTSAAPPAWAR
jgi:hypothetical protein